MFAWRFTFQKALQSPVNFLIYSFYLFTLQGKHVGCFIDEIMEA